MPGRKGRKPKDLKKNSQKNKDKKEQQGGWCTEDLWFDQDGCLYIANVSLAREMQQQMDSWGGRLSIEREKFDEEKSAAGGDDGGGVEGNKVNMMCSCSEPP